MLAQLDAGPVVLREMKRKLVIGPAAADQPRQWQWRSKRKLMRGFGTTTATQVNCAPLQGLENRRLWLSTKTWLQKSLRKVGAENAQCRTQSARKKKNLRRTPAQRGGGRCFSVENSYRWWNLGSSLRPTDENTINVMVSSSSRKKILKV